MATPRKPTSTGRSWGSLLQQAVAGVESRLDTILAEGPGEDTLKTVNLANATIPSSAATTRKDGGLSRSTSTSSRTNTRLQERLAKALTEKNATQKSDTFTSNSTFSPRINSGTISISPRGSLEVVSSGADGTKEVLISTADNAYESASEPTKQDSPCASVQRKFVPSPVEIPGALQPASDSITKPIIEITALGSKILSRPDDNKDCSHPTQQPGTLDLDLSERGMSEQRLPSAERFTSYEARIKQLQSDLETSEIQRQDEVHSYIERIDALQAKLQYLARESADSAKKLSNAAPPGTFQKRLADKEEQVALLMDEGQQLAKKELTHMMTIKKLRSKLQDDNKELSEARRKQQLAEIDAAVAKDQLQRSNSLKQQLTEKQKLVNLLQKDVELLKAERDAKDSTLEIMKIKLEESTSQANQVEARTAGDALQQERKRIKELEDDLANAKIERDLRIDRTQAQIKTSREQLDREVERTRMKELEMKAEQEMLESKLEVLRARAEEVSSGTTSDAQAKLLRQIETLQTQYAVASENWQGIEASLVARATSLELERDEATKRDGEMRRKARELKLKVKRSEVALEEACSNVVVLQQELSNANSRNETLKRRADEAELALGEALTSLEQERQARRLEAQQRADRERHKWPEEGSLRGSFDHNRAESPVARSRRGLTSEYLTLQTLQVRRASARSLNSDSPVPDKALPRRTSATPLRSSGDATPTRQDSLLANALNDEGSTTPSVATDHEEYLDDHSPSSPKRTIDDIISMSTAGAGPSVQLIERMSSAVRRLESEKASSKEHIVRLSTQRDEARIEIITLIKEIEGKREADRRVAELEAKVQEINSRYETTLEMLGEKSELVDELRSDIDDIKTMYRELVERTVN